MFRQDDLISVIIPVFNVDKYLRKCLDSVIAQTYKNLEIIVINDGSTDSSLQICREYENRGDITLISQENRGLSSARNAGLEAAHGAYISFVDSDDYVEPDFIEELYKGIVFNRSDLCICNFIAEDEAGRSLSNNDASCLHGNRTLTKSDFWHEIFTERPGNAILAWNKLYKREIFSELRFYAGHTHEDVYIMPSVIDSCKKISYISNELYHYLNGRPDSIMGKSNRLSFDFDKINSNIDLLLYFSKENYKKLYEIHLVNTIIDVSRILSPKNKSDKKSIKNLKKKILNSYKINMGGGI